MKEKIFEKLKDLWVSFENFEHNPVFSCDEARWVEVPWERVKTLFLRNKKPDMYYLVVLWDEKKLEANKLRILINEAKLSFWSPERMQEVIWVQPGHVSPFALINTIDFPVKVIFDYELKNSLIWFHPWRNDNTTVLKIVWVEKFIKSLGFDFEYLEL